MDLFSYRHGLKKNPDSYQLNSMSPNLGNRLWTCLFNQFFSVHYIFSVRQYVNPEHRRLCELIWDNYFKKPIDTLPADGRYANDSIREYFFGARWDEKYSFIEFCEQFSPDGRFANCINNVLEQEFAGYRLIDCYISPIIDGEEIQEIEKSLTLDNEVKEHIKTALKHLSDNKNPDYRNSIKESISAVEAICKKIVNNSKATLGDALNLIEKSGTIEFHGALKSGFSNLYGWTSTADGIRHGMMESSHLNQEDAKFMLIACSAFVNYLKVKADRAGIKIN